jgi:hypothetical protein
MASTKSETLSIRLADILSRLNNGAVLDPVELASEFDVSIRAIYRDINRLSPALDLLKDGRCRLAPEYRGKLRPRDLELFARIIGVEQLFPDKNQRVLMTLLDCIWYLAAVEDDSLKEVSLGDAGNLQRKAEYFEPQADIQHQIKGDDTWFNVDKAKVLLKVAR